MGGCLVCCVFDWMSFGWGKCVLLLCKIFLFLYLDIVRCFGSMNFWFNVDFIYFEGKYM